MSKAGTSLEAMEADVRGWLLEVLGEDAAVGHHQEALGRRSAVPPRACPPRGVRRAVGIGAAVQADGEHRRVPGRLYDFGVAAFDMFQTVDLFEA